MKIIIALIAFLILLATARTLTIQEEFEEVEIFTHISRSFWEGYMQQFHYSESFLLPDECFGDLFLDAANQFTTDIIEEEDYIILVIKIIERLEK